MYTRILANITGRYALLLFSIVYLAGIVAAVYQLMIGTSKIAFPMWLAYWLSTRKMLGLLALYSTLQHAIVTCLLLMPTSVYDLGPKGTSTKMNRYTILYNTTLYYTVPHCFVMKCDGM